MPYEIERKYIIAMPDTEWLASQAGYTESEIVQIYLNSQKGITHRVRSRAYGEDIVYTETVKIRIDTLCAEEIEREISEQEFNALSQNIADGTHPIIKRRLTFEYADRVIEIDIYPEWQRTAIMEIELSDRDASVNFPPDITVLREVTSDVRYKNASLARTFLEEII